MSQVPIPDDWDGTTWYCPIVEWPSSPQWKAIFAGILTWPLRGRFWDANTGSIVGVQDIAKQMYVRNNYGVFDMGCLEDLVVKLDCICNAVIAGSINRGSGGSGTFAQTPADFVDNGANYPDGYGTREAYVDSKCNLAQRLLDTWHSDLDKLKTVNVAGQAAGALAGLLVFTLATPIPFDDILLLISPILGLAAAGISVFVSAVEELQDRLDAMSICELYSAGSVTEAVDNVEAWIAAGSYSQQTLTVALGQYLIGTDAVNPLFSAKSDTINYDELPVGDCSSCDAPGCSFALATGSIVSGTLALGETVVIDSTLSGGFQSVQLEVTDPSGCCEIEVTINGAPAQPNAVGLFDCDETIYSGANISIPDGTEWCGRLMYWSHLSPFTITLAIASELQDCGDQL